MKVNYLTPQDVAERLSVELKTVWGWLRTGRLRGAKLTGRLWRISENDFERFIEQGFSRAEKEAAEKQKAEDR